jgi:hypothetical protein
VIGNLHTAALVGVDGTIDWLCLPAFDSPSVFCSVLDDEKGGQFSLRPVKYARSQQLYLPDTNVLLTRYFSPKGLAETLDFMPIVTRPGQRHRLVRNVRVIRGEVTFDAECRPAFDYARRSTRSPSGSRGPSSRPRGTAWGWRPTCRCGRGRGGRPGPGLRSARASGRRSFWRTSSRARDRGRYSPRSCSMSCCKARWTTGAAGSPRAPTRDGGGR